MISKPKVSFLLLVYNQEEIVKDAISGALSQNYPCLEIIISDDCSTDNSFEIIRSFVNNYDGPHKIIINKNEVNMGIAAHCNKLMSLASGDYFVMAAGDDISEPDRVGKVMEAWSKWPSTMAVRSQCVPIDQFGNKLSEPPASTSGIDAATRYEVVQNIPCYHGAVMCYRREVFDFFGPISDRCWSEDVVLGYRARLLGDIVSLGCKLVRYRVTGGVSTTSNTSLEKSLQSRYRKLGWLEQLVCDVEKVINANIVESEEGKRIRSFLMEKLEAGQIGYLLSSEKSFVRRFQSLIKLIRLDKQNALVVTNWIELMPVRAKKCLIFVRGTLINFKRSRIK